jgi:glycosyltransferase involved in cell wall biosynthesis
MKILFLAKRYWPHIGGVENHLLHLNHLLSANHQITVITEQHDSHLPEHEVTGKVEIFRIPIASSTSEKEQIKKWMSGHLQLLFSADIIHVHDVFFWLLPFRLGLANKKIFMTFHGYEAPGPPMPKQIIQHQLADFLCDGNICVGGFHKKWYGVEPDEVTFGAVDESQRKKTKTSKLKHHALFVGRLASDTGIENYLEAIDILHQQKKDIHLTVVGDGPLKEKSEKFVDKNHLPVEFVGAVEDVSPFYQRASVACVSGYLTILEAFQYHLPVISTYHNQLKKDYLTLTPFADWISILKTPEEIAAALGGNLELFDEAFVWSQKQTWSKLALQYETLWQKNNS